MLSPAKINLTLRVCGLRGDGFHEIESLVARVAWGDELRVEQGAEGSIELRFRAAEGGAEISGIPTDDRNLAVRAAKVLWESTGTRRGAVIGLRKRIPAGAGLGGGSSNAATTLKALNSLWSCGISDDRLCEIGAGIGSDVPLFLRSPVCVIRGRGERGEDRAERIRGFVTLILPDVHCSTPAVYRAWDELNAGARPSDRGAGAIESIVERSGSAAEMMEMLFNDLEPAAFRVNPELERLRDECERLAGGAVRMTGSGAAMFRLFDERAEAERMVDEVTNGLGVNAVVAPMCGAEGSGPGR